MARSYDAVIIGELLEAETAERIAAGVPTLLLGGMSAMGLLLVYSLNTWLPELMLRAGFNAKGSLSFLLVLNVGAIVGLLGLACSAMIYVDTRRPWWSACASVRPRSPSWPGGP